MTADEQLAVAIAVPGAIDAQPAFQPFVELAGRHAGPEAMTLLSTYFACGSLDEVERLVQSAGLTITLARWPAGVRAPK